MFQSKNNAVKPKSLLAKSSAGFTLIEVAITLTVLSIGILALVQAFPLAIKVSKSAEQSTTAANLAQAKIEELFYLDYDNIAIGTIEAKHRLSDDPTNPFYYYQRQTEVEYVDGDLNTSVVATGLKKATITMYWDNPLLDSEKNQEVMIMISEK